MTDTSTGYHGLAVPMREPEEIEVLLREDVDATDAIVIVGVPTVGLVGTISAHYLVDQLDMKEIGGLYSHRFPPVSRIREGRSSLPVRLHHVETPCGPEQECPCLIVVTTEFMPGPEMLHTLAEALTRWCTGNDVQTIAIPDGLLVEGEEGETIRAVGSKETTLDPFLPLGIERFDGGLLMGFSATMLAQAERLGADTVSFLAESVPDHPDARAAARLVELLDRIIPDIHIETKPLIAEAEQIEQQLNQLRSQLEAQADRHERPGYDQMYQ